jgi:hypothetical protein
MQHPKQMPRLYPIQHNYFHQLIFLCSNINFHQNLKCELLYFLRFLILILDLSFNLFKIIQKFTNILLIINFVYDFI